MEEEEATALRPLLLSNVLLPPPLQYKIKCKGWGLAKFAITSPHSPLLLSDYLLRQ